MNNTLQKRIVLLFFGFLIFDGNLQILKAETAFRTETIELERKSRFSINIDIPDGWQIRQERGTPVPGINQTYDLIVIPPSQEKGLLRITMGITGTGRSLPSQQFERLIDSRVSVLLPHAVEEIPSYHDIQLNDGIGKYCILTDASLVNNKPTPNDYIYLGIFFANYNNGCIVYSTLLADEIKSAIFQNMLKIVSSIVPSI